MNSTSSEVARGYVAYGVVDEMTANIGGYKFNKTGTEHEFVMLPQANSKQLIIVKKYINKKLNFDGINKLYSELSKGNNNYFLNGFKIMHDDLSKSNIELFLIDSDKKTLF